jgi:hypothetical protein
MEQGSYHRVVQIAGLGNQTSGIPIPANFKNAPGHQRMSLNSI